MTKESKKTRAGERRRSDGVRNITTGEVFTADKKKGKK